MGGGGTVGRWVGWFAAVIVANKSVSILRRLGMSGCGSGLAGAAGWCTICWGAGVVCVQYCAGW